MALLVLFIHVAVHAPTTGAAEYHRTSVANANRLGGHYLSASLGNAECERPIFGEIQRLPFSATKLNLVSAFKPHRRWIASGPRAIKAADHAASISQQKSAGHVLYAESIGEPFESIGGSVDVKRDGEVCVVDLLEREPAKAPITNSRENCGARDALLILDRNRNREEVRADSHVRMQHREPSQTNFLAHVQSVTPERVAVGVQHGRCALFGINDVLAGCQRGDRFGGFNADATVMGRGD